MIANATGCSSVYASTMPYNSYLDPWVNSLFQDAQPLAKGIFEGISAQVVPDVRALRLARARARRRLRPGRARARAADAVVGGVHPRGAATCCRP